MPLGPTLVTVEPSSKFPRYKSAFISTPGFVSPRSGSVLPGVANANSRFFTSGRGMLLGMAISTLGGGVFPAAASPALRPALAILVASFTICSKSSSSMLPLMAIPSGNPSASSKKSISAARSISTSPISLCPAKPKMTSPTALMPNLSATCSSTIPGTPSGSCHSPSRSSKMPML